MPYHTLFLEINFHRDLLNVRKESRTYFRSRLCGICKQVNIHYTTHALTLCRNMEKNQAVLSNNMVCGIWTSADSIFGWLFFIFISIFHFYHWVIYNKNFCNKDFETNSCAHYIKKDIIVKNHEKEANDCGIMKGRHIGIACDILNPIIRDEISGIFPDFFLCVCKSVSI